jgi:hypothetical protein
LFRKKPKFSKPSFEQQPSIAIQGNFSTQFIRAKTRQKEEVRWVDWLLVD